MNPIHAGSIVRISGRPGDYRVLSEGIALGTHVPTLYLEATRECWVKHRTEKRADCYPSLLTLTPGNEPS